MARKSGMIRSAGLNHINLNVTNLKRSTVFYRKAFGLRVRFSIGQRMVFLSSPGARDVITLYKAKKGDPIGNGGVSHFGFDMKGPLDKCIAQIERAGGKLIERGEHGDDHPYAYIADPDGYIVEIGS